MQSLSLYELNRMVSEVLALSLNGSYWVVAEIASLNDHVSGHCYLELVEKDEASLSRSRRPFASSGGGKFRAQARATVWRNTWISVARKFREATGQDLAKGMKVLLEVSVSFHEVYGYSLNVNDVDPSYTLGDMARKRNEIILQLQDDGVYDLNRELPLPRPLQRIAVISAQGAAGYGDFCRQLDESGFRFVTSLFPAVMQGSEVERSVVSALERVAADLDSWDCVVIIRGGGSVADLNGFESYYLAASVAQFPLPVFTGIGHERDDTVIDLVAHTRLKTPTAVAQHLIDMMQREYDEVCELEDRLRHAAASLLLQQRQRYSTAAHRFERAAHLFTSSQRQHLLRLTTRLERAHFQLLERQRRQIDALGERLSPSLQRLLERQHHRLAMAERALAMAGPERILRMGYSITFGPDGQPIRSTRDVTPGAIITTQLNDGLLTSQVTK